MKKTQLFNRYKDNVYLQETNENNKYLLVVPDIMKDFICCNYEGTWNTNTCNIVSVDPSGGPYLQLGDTLPWGTIEKIIYENNDYYIIIKSRD